MCSIIRVRERLHEVLGQIDFGKLDLGERSLPFGLLVSNVVEKRVIMDWCLCLFSAITCL